MGTLDTYSPSSTGTPLPCDLSHSPLVVKQTRRRSTLTQLHHLNGPHLRHAETCDDKDETGQSPQLRNSPSVKDNKRVVSFTFKDEKARLRVKRVIGTTATSTASFCCVGNFVAYTSGAGAVITQLHEKLVNNGGSSTDELTVSAERFFCTSPRMIQQFQQLNWTSHMMKQDSMLPSQQGPPARDENGFLQYGGVIVKSMIDSIGVNSGNDFDSPSNTASGSSMSSISVRDRIKTTSCLSLSPNGKLLAVGETGYQPQVLVYSTAWNSSNSPLVMLGEHSFGVKLLSFSHCGRFLASLGTTNDGFLHVWNLSGLRESNTVKLHSSNRCISVINDMKWSGSTLITAGTRHLRIWKIANYSKGVGSGDTIDEDTSFSNDGSSTVLSGRNVILGDFSGSNFVSIVQVSPGLLVVATDKGELATLEDAVDEGANSKSRFIARLSVGFPISAMDIDFHEHMLWVTGPTEQDMR